MKEREKGMPKWCFRRKESPFIWYKFKVNGKTYTGSTEEADKKLAESIVGKLRTEANEGKIKDLPCNLGLRDLIQTVFDKRQCTAIYRRSTLNVVDWMTSNRSNRKAAEIKPQDVDEYHLWRVQRASESTVNRELGYFQSCYNYARKRMKLNLEDPVAGWERFDENLVARDRFMTMEERSRLMADKKYDRVMKDIFVWVCQTGMRKGEVIQARWSGINWADKTIKIQTLKKKKRGAVSEPFRYVPLNIYAMDIIKRRRLDGWENNSIYVFSDAEGGVLSRHGQITTAFEYACLRNKINKPEGGRDNIRFHDLRHTFATDFLRANHDIKALKALSQIMGHSEESITKRYTHLWPEDQRNQIALLPPVPGYNILEITTMSYVRATIIK